MEQKMDEKKILTVLDELYGEALNGVPKVSKPIEDLAKDYLEKNSSPEITAKELIKYQIAKCGTSGFVSGLGGALTLPANVTGVLYIQLRMIAAIAFMGGFEIQSDQVQTIAYACLTGSAVSDVLRMKIFG